MAITTRQSSLLVAEDWTKLYQTFRNADFQSYDYETLRKSMVDYLRLYYPEDFNDWIHVRLANIDAFDKWSNIDNALEEDFYKSIRKLVTFAYIRSV